MRHFPIAKPNLTSSGFGLGALLVLLTSCAQSVGDIDRTQPDLVPKDAFEGQWFIRQSVIDVPATSTGAFIGEMQDMEVVVWEVQEDALVGYRAYEKVPGSEAQAEGGSGVASPEVPESLGAGKDKTLFKGNPIVAYTITSHVDVQRDYNPRTGEQTNVISENTTDRPWQERQWMRVDWSENVVDNFLHKPSFMFGASQRAEFIPESEGGADAFRMEADEDGKVNYIDFTERHFVEPNVFGCIMALRANEIGDCTSDEIKVRTSLLKVDVAREQDYEPMFYDDRRQGEFGYFRTERPSYDRGRGNTFTGLQQFANRHEIWAENRDSRGNLKPYADRKLRPVVYHLSPGYPQDLVQVAEQMAEEYDKIMKEVAAAARGQSFEELASDVKKDTGGACLFCLNLNKDGAARIGDLRYNFMYWVDDDQQIGPLGYGPSSAHPQTGRIVSSAAYVYGAAIDRYAVTAKDIVDGLNGELSEDDLIGFDYIKEAVREGLYGVPSSAAEELATIPLDEVSARVLGDKATGRLNLFKELGPAKALTPYSPGYAEAALRRIQGTELESLMVSDEMETLFDPHGYFPFKLGDRFTVIQGTNIPSVVHWGTKKAIDQLDEINNFASKNNLWLEEFSDPAIVGLAREMQRKNIKGEELRKRLKESVYRAVMLHEVGHTVGLRHNFGGSADALNYHDEYWELRAKTLPQAVTAANDSPNSLVPYLRSNCAVIDATSEAPCEEQVNGRMAEFQYSTIMDYGSRFNVDSNGLGHWDRAAIASAYGNLVEVFDESVRVSQEVRSGIQDANNQLTPVLGQGLPNALDRHYSDLPNLLGGVGNLGKRKFIPRSEWDNSSEAGPLKVPYMSCYDEFVGAVDTCNRWDFGADNFEITADYIQRYKEYYVFNNFQRDRVGFNGFDVFARVAGRFLLPITGMYQHWLFDRFGGKSQATPQAALGTLATRQGFYTLWNIMAAPGYGSYDERNDTYVQVTQSPKRELDETLQAPLYIAPGQGRRTFSRLDLNSGYNPFQRVLESGHFYDQMAALLALTNSDATVLGAGGDIQGDLLSYSIPYYLIFDDDLNTLFSGVFTEDYAKYSPRLVNGKLVERDVFNTVAASEFDAAPVVETRAAFLVRIQSLIYAAASFKSNYDTEFLKKAQISILGSGDDRMPPPGFEPVIAHNPIVGTSYVAYRPIDPARQGESWLGAELVARLNELSEALAASQDPEEQTRLGFAISDVTGDIEIVRTLYELFQYL